LIALHNSDGKLTGARLPDMPVTGPVARA
jgi:hypothetical protein